MILESLRAAKKPFSHLPLGDRDFGRSPHHPVWVGFSGNARTRPSQLTRRGTRAFVHGRSYLDDRVRYLAEDFALSDSRAFLVSSFRTSGQESDCRFAGCLQLKKLAGAKLSGVGAGEHLCALFGISPLQLDQIGRPAHYTFTLLFLRPHNAKINQSK